MDFKTMQQMDSSSVKKCDGAVAELTVLLHSQPSRDRSQILFDLNDHIFIPRQYNDEISSIC